MQRCTLFQDQARPPLPMWFEKMLGGLHTRPVSLLLSQFKTAANGVNM